MLEEGLAARAKAWVAQDPNECTASHVQHLLDVSGSSSSSADENQEALELAKLFPNSKRIAFGTAGLRSKMMPGPLGMNDLVVLQTAQGLARYCEQQHKTSEIAGGGDKKDPSKNMCAIIGYDHRANPALQISSLSFALLSALVFLEAGWDCLLLDGFVPTPLVPFSMGQMKQKNYAMTIGIMITASHNPKEDAGYKVYWKDGCQIRSPVDKGMAAAIDENLTPWTDYKKLLQVQRGTYADNSCLGLSQPETTARMLDAYYAALSSSGLVTEQTRLYPATLNWKPPRFLYSAMHGVGHKFAKRSFATFGLPPFESVSEQQEPDPSFPTVAFPNPEEKGALDLAQAHAVLHGCDIILANDPDADRLAVAEKDRGTGAWTVFSGDQIGSLLGHWLWQQYQSSATAEKPLAMCASTVSSKLLAEIARVEGFYFEDTLTGFKWIGSRAAELHQSGKYTSVFCYEEAIGFCCGNVIFDKDGISAMSVMAELAWSVYQKNKTLAAHMQSLYDQYGEFVSDNGYYVMEDNGVIPDLFHDMTQGGDFASVLSSKVGGTYAVSSVRYLGEPGYDSTKPDKRPTLPTSKSSPMMTIGFCNGCVAQFRASGTEPKFKYYIELKGAPGVTRRQVEADLETMSEVLLKELVQPERFGLKQR